MRRTDAPLVAFEASGLDGRYRVLAELAGQGDAWARELLLDAIRASELRAKGLVTFEDYQRRSGLRARCDALYACDDDNETTKGDR
jgi:hypothetical protein